MTNDDMAGNAHSKYEFTIHQINDYIGQLPYFYNWKWDSKQKNNFRQNMYI